MFLKPTIKKEKILDLFFDFVTVTFVCIFFFFQRVSFYCVITERIFNTRVNVINDQLNWF